MPRNRALACAGARPDDDAYGVAGSVALHADEDDFRSVLIHATNGEGGDIRFDDVVAVDCRSVAPICARASTDGFD